jgi:hypothetical protein
MNAQSIPLPFKGVNKGIAVAVVPMEYSSHMNNIRPSDVLEKRLRLGKRPGLKKWGEPTQIGGADQPVVAMCSVSTVRI